VYDTPGNTFVAGFIGNPPMNFLKSQVQGLNGHRAAQVGGHAVAAPVPTSVTQGQNLLLGIRAENIEASLTPVEGALPAQVLVIEPLGSHLLLTVEIGGEMIKVVTRVDFPVNQGDTIYLRMEMGKIRWYDPESGLPVAM
jgi:multiple sugar transport system ATP-binding protein